MDGEGLVFSMGNRPAGRMPPVGLPDTVRDSTPPVDNLAVAERLPHPEPGSRWRHADGSEYVAVGYARGEMPGQGWACGVAYVAASDFGRVYWRSLRRFHERFTEVLA